MRIIKYVLKVHISNFKEEKNAIKRNKNAD